MHPDLSPPRTSVASSIWQVPHWRSYWLARPCSNVGSAVTLVILPPPEALVVTG